MVAGQLEDEDGFVRRVHELYATTDAQGFDVLRFKNGRVVERYSIPQRIGADVVGRVWSFRDVTDRERMLRGAQFLADAGRLLGSLDVEKALESVARLTVSYLGDGCAIDLLSDVGGAHRLLAIDRDPTRTIKSEIPRTVLAGRSLIYATNGTSYMSVPMPGRSTLFGVVTFVAGGGRRYTEPDLELAEDLARRIAMAIENAHLYRGAQDALHAREEFLSIAAHEIRGPITAIHLAVQGLRRGRTDSRAGAKLLDIVEREDRRLARFVDELLDVTRIRGGRLHFDLERVDLGEITREVVARLGPEIAPSGSSLSVVTDGDLVGLWDRIRLDQVVTNLLSNAVKFGLGKSVEVIVHSDDARATLLVRDHGIGVDPGMEKRIFDPFARAVSARNYGGLGLGLYIVRTIVEGLGGAVRVETTAGGGSTFTVELPRSKEP
jgi:signal transduction histidine kinase